MKYDYILIYFIIGEAKASRSAESGSQEDLKNLPQIPG